MNKNIIFIGSNSNFVQNIIQNKCLLKNYNEIFLLSHRHYRGIETDYIVLDNLNTFEIFEAIKKIVRKTKMGIFWDILISNTPPQYSNFNNHVIREWSITSIKLINFLSYSSNINRVILLGSSLSFVPFLRNSKYKSLKKIEFQFFYYMGFRKDKKIGFCILPPIRPGVKGMGKLFSQEQNYWSKKIINEFNKSNNIIMPSGIIGFILKLLLMVKCIKI